MAKLGTVAKGGMEVYTHGVYGEHLLRSGATGLAALFWY